MTPSPTFRNPNEVLTNFGYDEKNRLIHADYPGSPRESFSYDILGNLKRWEKSDGGAIPLRGHRLTYLRDVSDRVVVRDPEGELTT